MKTRIVLSVVFSLLWILLGRFVFMPTLSLSASTGLYWLMLIILATLAVVWFKYDDGEFGPVSGSFSVASGTLLITIAVLSFFSTSSLVNSGEYRGLIGEVRETNFSANVQPVSINQMIIVDGEIARRLGDKVIGSIPGLGSRCELGKFTLQSINKGLYWVAPLLHSGFFKWNKFSDEGTPGYVIVSATNQDDYKLVTEVAGKKIHIKYQQKSFFSQYLSRHIYLNGYSDVMYGDITFEVDNNLKPYWTVTLYDSKVGYSGYDATGVLVVDPETGEMTKYKIEDAPKWIDRIQPIGFVKSQVDDWGNYIHGPWNWSGEDKLSVSRESSIVLGNDGRSYYYFGLTSSGADSSTVGFVMVDTRTKKTQWFKQSGATEDAARTSAEGKVQEKGYHGSDGVTYNIDGHATYEFLLKDKSGLMKMIALVNVKEYSIVGIGESRQEAIQDYRNQLNNRGNASIVSSSDMELKEITSKVYRIAVDVVRGNSVCKIILKEMPNTLFVCASAISDEVLFTKEDDVVSIKYYKNNMNTSISIKNFDNKNIRISKDVAQIKNESAMDSVRESSNLKKSSEVVDDKINNLSLEEKRALLKKMNK